MELQPLLVALLVVIAFTLHGCGGGGGGDTTTTIPTETTTTSTDTKTTTTTITITTTTTTTTTTTLPPAPPGPLPWCKPKVRAMLSTMADKYAQSYKVPVGVGIAGKVPGDAPGGCVFDAVGFPSGWVMEEEYEGRPAPDAFLMGSFTKMWTASAILKLFEEGKLDLDAPAHTYFEKAYQKETGGSRSLDSLFGPGIWKVTTRDLLNMRGAIADYDELEYQAQHPSEDIGPGRSTELFGKAVPNLSPGTCGVYSSMSFVILGLILVQESGADEWYSYNQNVWSNLLPDIRFGTRGPCSAYTRIQGHCQDCDTKGLNPRNMSCTGGFSCGNMIARPRDAAAFMYSLFRGKLLKLSTVSNMTEYDALGDPGATNGTKCFSWNQGALYGLGVQAPAYGTTSNPATATPGHAGVTYGFMSVNAFDRVHDLAISATAANDVRSPIDIYLDAHTQITRLSPGTEAEDVVI